MSEFQALIEAVLNTDTIDKQLNELKNKKIELDVEVKKDKGKQIASTIEKSIASMKVDTKAMSKQLANSFNISDKSIIGKIQSQMDSMISSLAKTFNGKRIDLSKATGFYDGIDGLAKTVTENANVIQSKMGIYDDFYKYFKDKKIYVSDALKSELGGSRYKDLLQNNVGKIVRDASKGVSIDSIWGEMTSMFPEHFSENLTTQADQILRAFDVLKAARADIDTIIPASQFSPEQLFATTGNAYDQIVSMASTLKSTLQQNLSSAMDMDKTTIDLNVEINTEKIVADIRSALQSATTANDTPIDVHLNMNEEEIIASMRNAINRLGAGDEPVQVDIQVNRQSLQADINAALEGLDLPIHFNIDAAELEADIRNAVNRITDIEIDLHVNTDGIRRQVDDSFNDFNRNGIDTSSANELQHILNNINSSGSSGTSVFKTFGSTLREAFATFTLANILQDSIYKVIRVGKEGISTVKELNDAALSLQMATGDSYESIKNMMNQYNQMGQELGGLTSSVAEGADTWLRQGKSAEEANSLIKDTMVLSKVSNLDAADSAEYLTSAMKGYKVAVEDVSEITDKISSIDMASATDAGGLAEGMSKVAVTASQAGVSMDKLLAYLASVGEVSQDGMSEVGNSLKTIFTRMSDIKGGKLELIDEDGTSETLSDVELTLSKVGIDLRKTVTEYNSYSDVLDSLAAKWDTLNETQQNALAKAFAGTRQQNRFRILMENYDNVLKYESIAQNSSGTAEEKFQFYLDSLEGKTNSLKASLEGLATSTISDELYAGVLDTTKAMVDLTTQTGILKGALAGLGTGGALFAFQSLAKWIQGAIQEFSNLDAAMNIVNSGTITENNFTQLIGLTDGLTKSQTKLILSSTALSDAQRVAILMNQGMSQAEAQATISSMGLATAQGTATAATVTLSGALRGLFATLMSNPFILIAMGVTAAVTAFTSYKNKVQESVNAAKEAGNTWDEQNSSLSDNISKITELRNALASGTLSEQEAANAKSELLSIQESLTDSYGNQISHLDLVNGKLEEQIALLNQVSRAEANQYLNENKKGIEKAEKEMTKERSMYLGSYYDNQSDSTNALTDVLLKYKEKGISVEKAADGISTQVRFEGDASLAKETLNDLMSDFRKLKDTYGEIPEISLIDDNAASQLQTINEVLSDYQDIYLQAKSAQLIVDNKNYGAGADSKKASDWMNDYTKAVQNYNDALASGDSKQIDQAKTKFDDVDESVQGLLKDQDGLGQYSSIFEDIKNQAGNAAIATQEFSDAVDSAAEKAKTDNTYDIEDIILKADSTFAKAKSALDSANKGATYTSMMEMQEKIGELRKSGDTGTDDFKTFAAMISPTGATDTANYDENIAKFNRYFTEDNSGIINFLEDLQKKGLATSKTLSDGTKEWSYNIDDLEQAARKMGMGFEPFMAIFGELEDKGFHNDFFSTQDEGISHLVDLYGKLGTAEQELQDLYDKDPGNSTAIEAKKNEIEELKGRIDATTSSLEKLLNKNISDYEEEDKAAKAGLQSQIDAYNKNKNKLSDAAKKRLLKDIQDTGTEYGYDNIGEINGKLVLDTSLAQKSLDEVKNESIPDKIVKLVGEDDATGILILWNNLKVNEKFASLTAEDQATYLIGYWNSLTPKQQEAIINGKDEATPILDKIQRMEIKPKDFTVSAVDKSTGVLSSVKGWLDKIRDKSVTVTTYKRTVATSSSADYVHGNVIGGNTQANGTIHPAHAQGTNVSIKKNEDAVVNELGNEGLIRNGVLREIPGGLHIEHLKRGDIILNHLQMKELKKYGYVTSNGGRGKLVGSAFAKGTIPSLNAIPAYPGGTGGGTTGGNTGTSSTSSDDNSGSKKKTKKKTDKTKSALEKFQEAVGKFFDWIEIRLDRLERRTDKYMTKAENAATLSTANKYTNKAIIATRDEQSANSKAATRYNKQAEKVARLAVSNKVVDKKTMDNIKKNVASGKINISEYSEKVQEVIKNYQTWYEKAEDCKKAVEDLKQQEKELYQQRLDNIEDYYGIKDDLYSNRISKAEALIDLLEKQGKNVTKDSVKGAFGSKTSVYGYQESALKTQVANAQKTYEAYFAEYNKQVKAGKLTGKDKEAALATVNELHQAWIEAKSDYEDYKDALRELDYKPLEQAIESIQNALDKLQARNDLAEKRGNKKYNNIRLTESSVQEEIGLNNDQIKKLYEKRQMKLNDMAQWEQGSTKWQEAKNEVDELDSSILQLLSDNEDAVESIRKIRWDAWEKGIETIDYTMSELQDLQGLLNNNNFISKSGSLTKDGYANIALYGEMIGTQQKKISEYRKALEKLQEEYNNNNISLDELTEQSREYMDAIRDSVGEIENYKESLLDMYTEMLEKQNEVLDENIEKRKDAISAMKDYHDYQKTINTKSKDINSLKAQIAALEGVSNQASKAKLAQLKADLAEKEDDLAETKYDHEYEMRITGFDKMQEDADEALENILDNLERNTSEQQRIIDEMLDTIKEHYSDAYDTINNKINETGLVTSQNTQSMINQLSSTGAAVSDLSLEYDKLAESITKAASIDTSTILKSDSGVNNAEKGVTSNSTLPSKQTTTSSNSSSSNTSTSSTTTKKPSLPTHLPGATDLIVKVVSSTKPKVSDIKHTLQEGMSGSAVKTLQKGLNATMKSGLTVDGKFGSKTKSALKAFQKKYKLTQNGVLDSKTKTKFRSLGYARGTKRVPEDGIYPTQELGSEIIYHNGMMLTPLNKEDMVFSHEMSDNLWKIAQQTPETMAKKWADELIGAIPPVNVQSGGQVVNNYYSYDSVLKIEGSTSAVTKDELTNLAEKFKEINYEYTSKKMFNGAIKGGAKRRI